MTRQEYVKKVAEKLDVTQIKAKEIIEDIEDIIFEAVKTDDEIPMGKIGRIGGKDKPATQATNPRTGEKIKVPAKTGQPYAKFSKTIKA